MKGSAKHLRESLAEFLERSKDKFRFAFYDPRRDEIVLVREQYRLTNNNREYYNCTKGGIFGHHVLVDMTKHWVYLGDVDSRKKA